MQRIDNGVVTAVVFGAMLVPALLHAAAPETAPSSLPVEFLVGDYAVIGQRPDSTRAYSGTARIELRDGQLLLTRRVGKREITAPGRFEVPQPPGEGSVLRFRWREQAPVIMTCLVSGDLDNYARLTCTVVVEGRDHPQPGIEALFPTAAWPQGVPSKIDGSRS